MNMQFEQRTLDNGLTLIAEAAPRAHSAAIGFFVRTGSRDETPDVSGVSHFLEHMAFKGNDRYQAADVNRIFDEVGARYNASTSEEVTLFYAAVLPEYLDRTFELLAALLFPSLREEDFETEKQVILEEIGMYEDMPGYLAHEKAMQVHFAAHPLGRSILGPAETIRALTIEQMRRYHQQRYRAGNITLAGAGRLTMTHLTRLAERCCAAWPEGAAPRDAAPALPARGTLVVLRPQSQQQHLALISSGPPAASPARFAAELLSIVVGDALGSRLYWELVDPGHAESAELSYNDYDGSGAWLSYLCCRPEQTRDNLTRIARIYRTVSREGISEQELDQARNKAASRIVLQSERPIGRLASLGGNWVYRREYRSVQDDLAALRRVTTSDVAQLLEEYPLEPTTTVAVGPLEQLPNVP